MLGFWGLEKVPLKGPLKGPIMGFYNRGALIIIIGSLVLEVCIEFGSVVSLCRL